MKKYLLSFLNLFMIIIFTSCSVSRYTDSVSSTTEVTPYVSSLKITESSFYSKGQTTNATVDTKDDVIHYETESSVITTEIIDNQKSSEKSFFHATLDCFIEALLNNDQELINYICYGTGNSTNWINNVKFSSVTVIDQSVQENSCLLRLNIIESNDSRFTKGESDWVFRCYDLLRADYFAPLVYAIPETDIFVGLFSNDDNSFRGNLINIAYNLSVCFDVYMGIQEIDLDNFTEDDICAYIYGAVHCNQKHYGDLVTISDANKFIQDTLGVSILNRDDFKILGEIDFRFENISSEKIYYQQYFTVDEFTDTYIDLTYYADICHFTPAITLRYFYERNDDLPLIKSVEVLHGYECDILTVYQYGPDELGLGCSKKIDNIIDAYWENY